MAVASTSAFDLRQKDILLHVGAIHDSEPHVDDAHGTDLALSEAVVLVKLRCDGLHNTERGRGDTVWLLNVIAVGFNEAICRCSEAAEIPTTSTCGSCAS